MPEENEVDDGAIKIKPQHTGSSKFSSTTAASGEVIYEGEWIATLTHKTDEEKEDKELNQDENEVPEETKKRHGQGTLSFVSLNEKYEGSWSFDVMEGEGKFSFASGAKYVGSFKNNCFEGFGEYVWPDGAIYTGEWCANMMHGTGSYVANGTSWQGEFLNGKFKGTSGTLVDLRLENAVPATMQKL